MKSRRTSRSVAILLLVIMVLPPAAQAQQLAARADNAAADVATKELDLLVGRSAVIRTDRPISRVSLSTPDIADALVTSPYEVLVHGKLPGTISLLIWADNGRIQSYDVAVRRDLSPLAEQLKSLFPGEKITVAGNGKDVVLSGVVSSKYIVDRASSLAVGYVDKAENVVNLIRQQEGVATNQVLLKVRFAEVSRSAMQELGASIFTGNSGHGDWIGRTTTQQFPAPDFSKDSGLVFSDFLNLFAFNTEEQLGVVVKALKTKGLFQSLAEPNLITQDGKEASFLAGGEYPYPVLQGGIGGNQGVTIVFKEFGVRLRFTPTITADDMIQLKVAPEVSTLDFGNGLTLSGFKVPALATRRTDTQVELRDGQTFAIAGLMDQTVSDTMRKVPGIGDIPILGYLFKSQAYEKHSSELVVMITPHIVRRDSPGVTPNLPGFVEPFLTDPKPRIAPPAPSFTTPQAEAAPAMPAAQTATAAKTKSAKPAAAAAAQVATPAPAQAAPAPVRVDAATAPAPAVQAAQAAPAVPAAQATPAAPAVQAAEAPVEKKATAADRKAAEKANLEERERLVAAAQQRQRDAEQARIAGAAEAKRAEQQKKKDAEQARVDQEKAREAAKVEAERVAKQMKELNRAKQVDAERQEAENKIAEQKAAEQAALDRKRWTAQQAEAARLKEESDRLAKEQDKQREAQDKLAKAQAAREAELSRLVEQYKKLTAVTQSSATQ